MLDDPRAADQDLDAPLGVAASLLTMLVRDDDAAQRAANGRAALPLLERAARSRGAPTVMPPPIAESASEPVRYVGKGQTDKRFYDGALRHAVGVQNVQVIRPSADNPSLVDGHDTI